ncbi:MULTISPECIES: hypothetical protein [Azospirillum]|uniref:Uncharacterized protein n=1 Tax=Azospirillum brasilense TaxID=192 RepID=A0ABU4NXK5_AZOBR|nr:MULTISPECIES: hypothetical protein [Azospirillum]MDW7555517.1 hypothetical protein [Azospirillum brasilense]MDW7595075.1 hypothetical protein [Azospirillum brasilense]MDW7630228.1 hypothetical protein [Azospirillum brasilense]MDX5949596.1 hypothetical protein [Azospirillum brasilense]TVZ67540.1 hypothetical protein OH82_00680 [Azospirillum brasilense]
MTPSEVSAELVRRCIPSEASPEAKAEQYREILAAVNAAGRYAEPAWVLVRDGKGDVLAAFTVQVEAFKATAPKASPAPAPVIRPSSWRRELVRVAAPRGL